MATAMFNKHRMVRRGGVEILAGEPTTIARLGIVIFKAQAPSPWRELGSSLTNGFLDIGDQTEITIDFTQVASPGVSRMCVGVDKPRHNSFAV